MDIGYIYLGFYDDIILCVSDDKSAVSYYLKKIRKLPKGQYDIRSVIFTRENAETLYDEYVLEPYTEEFLWLTRRDIEYLNEEINRVIDSIDNMIRKLSDIQSIMSYGSNDLKFEKTLKTIEDLMYDLNKANSKVKSITRIARGIVGTSQITNAPIEDYLCLMKQCHEDRELTNLFYQRVEDED